MKTLTTAVVSFVFVTASSIAMAEGGGDRMFNRMNEAGEAKHTIKELLKEGTVVSIAPKGTAGTTNAIQNYTTNGKVRTYEMKVRTPDGKIHAVEYLGAPIGVDNG
ncbi:co-regulatory protein PtrA N-terminal domain-containing protein [Stutzerimonas stutzeri]|jgi:hypothetical protein|uniref:co-regulatory protein PtrA N-terminal domain-containing protein n=1 Tax=Stutzerimonas stutzeri TaxID=316 RepID=UPI0009BE5B1B|nr:co-regulatory protein PtrA N-terminal domain-containing protein [Stutzerimonas stutzeri]HAW22383.1 hypothetical protein [Pseudomonas sp.]